jgi:hypothetical protein
MVAVMTPEKIHHSISSMISQGVPYIDALITFAEQNGLEIETVAAIIKRSSILKEKVRAEAVQLRMVKKDEDDLVDILD